MSQKILETGYNRRARDLEELEQTVSALRTPSCTPWYELRDPILGSEEVETPLPAACSLLLEPVRGEPQGPAILGDGADDVVGDTVGDLGLDLQRHLDP